MTDKCSCTCGRDAVPHKDRSDLSTTCRKRWVGQGCPPGPVAPPFGHAARKLAARPLHAFPDGTCGCGHCGLPAVRPAKNPVISEQCYRRSLALGLGGYVPPPPRVERIRQDGRPARKSGSAPAIPPVIPPPPEPPAAAVWADEASRRIPAEITRARAYVTAWNRRDFRGVDTILAKVDDLDAFDALLDTGLDETKATAALAEQLATQFPHRQQHEEETAAA